MADNAPTILTTEQYAKQIYCNYTRSRTCSQQYIRRLIAAKKDLPHVKKIHTVNKYYHLLEIEQGYTVAN